MNADSKRVALLIAAAAVIVGSIMPWATVRTVFGSVDVAGTDGDGVLTLIGGAAAGVAALLRRHVLGAIAFGLVGAIALYDVVNVSDALSDVDSALADASVGWGLWLILVAAIAGVVLSVVRSERSDRPASVLRSRSALDASLPPPSTRPSESTVWTEVGSSAHQPERTSSKPAGWYTDPGGRFDYRWFDSTWTEHVANEGDDSTYTDPVLR